MVFSLLKKLAGNIIKNSQHFSTITTISLFIDFLKLIMFYVTTYVFLRNIVQLKFGTLDEGELFIGIIGITKLRVIVSFIKKTRRS